ncbi:MAG: CpaD family pilus assembly lipoprotein [Phenylobacterium sp.]|uniref:CpaD family pilus assembly lipoprotein n=1 Tax=Phenylobacterium sp. TaxID=1871053 RepID=UPI00391D2E83
MTHPAISLFAAAALSAGLAACATKPAPDAVADARTPTEQFAPQVSAQPEEIRLAPHAQGLSANQAAALAAMAQSWRDAEAGAIRIQAPAGEGPDGAAVHRTAEGARARLAALGVPDHMIELVGYDAAGDAAAPIVVGFLRHQVSIPQCGQKWTNLARSAANQVQPNFGCAVTANMAAQIANPADLAAPRGMDPADAGRRETVLEKYRAGQVTSAAADQRASGAVSQAVR